MLTLTLCLIGVGSAAAEKVYATFENPANTSAVWDKETSSFSWTQSWYNQIGNIGLPTGDLSNYKKLVVDYEILEGDQFRILFYDQGVNSNLTLYVKTEVDGAKGVKDINIFEALSALDGYSADFILKCGEIKLSGAGNSGKVKINSMYLETYADGEEKPNVKPEEDEADPGKPAGDFIDFTTVFPNLQPQLGIGTDGHPIKLGNGAVVVGQRSKAVIADLSGFSKLTMVTSPNLKVVLYMNHEIDAKQNAGDYTEEDAGKYLFQDLQADENGLIEFDLTQLDKQDLNCICLPWDNSNKGTVWYLLLTEKEGKTVYLNPGIWDVADATERYAAYMFNDNGLYNWTNFAANGEGILTATIPARYTGIVLCRMNGETTENNWENKWNQTDDIKPITNDAVFTITGWGEGDNAKSTYEVNAPDVPVEDVYTVAGNNANIFGAEWNTTATANDLTKNADGTYSITYESVALEEDVEYKVVKNHAWDEAWPSSNRIIGINMPGTYDVTIHFNPATGEVWETMAVYKEITDAGYATFCAPYALNFEGTGVQAFFAKNDQNDGKLHFYEIFNAPLTTGLLLKAPAGTYKLKMESVEGEAKADLTGNILQGVRGDSEYISSIYVLLDGDKGVGFYKTTKPFTVKAWTAFIGGEASSREFIALGDETTGIKTVATTKANGEIFNLNGQRVVKAQKGLYIINGKKVLVK